jgi:ferredoxin
MKTKLLISRISSSLLISVFILLFISCSTEQSLKKPLSFNDVEKELKFAKPLSENSKKVIIKQYGSVENYKDSIIERRNAPNKKKIIVTGHPSEADSAAMKIFRMTKDELKKAGIKVTADSTENKSISSKVKSISSKTQASYNVQIWNAPSNHLYVLNIRDDDYILEDAEAAGADDLPASCRAGACCTCCSKLIQGSIDCSEQTFYDADQLAAGYFPMCVAYPTSDSYISASQENNL